LFEGGVVTDQLALFDLELNGNGHGGWLTKAEAGIAKGIPAGAERLLAELVRRGLPEGDLQAAAALALELDRGANGVAG
jgi:hypothetical protein